MCGGGGGGGRRRRVYRYARAVAVSLVFWGFAVRGTDRVLIGQGYCSLGGRTHSGGMWVVQIIAAILHPSGKDKTYCKCTPGCTPGCTLLHQKSIHGVPVV